MQNCSNCKENKNISTFEKLDSGNIRKVCRTCRNKQIVENAINKKDKILKTMATIKNKTCSECKQNKIVSEFNKRLRSVDGYNSKCKSCYKLIRKPNKKIINHVFDENLNKHCSTCSYIGNNFRRNDKSEDNYYHKCNNCWKPIEWNKEKQKISEKKYCMNNKEKLREKWKKQGLKINRRIRDSLNKRIKSCLYSKKNKTFEYTDCDAEFLKLWFEYNFTEEMGWNNYGNWHIDHIKPCSSFDFSVKEDIITCFNWKNLRPCWGVENMEKSNKIDLKLIEQYKIKAQIFIKNNPTTKFDMKISDGSMENIEV